MIIKGTKNTPSVRIDEGIIEIKGRSIPEDAFDFYSPIQNEIQTTLPQAKGKTEINLHLEYINSGSKKFLTTILGNLEEMYLKGQDIVIYWHYDYDDDSMLELGNDFRSMIQAPFHIIEVK